MNMEFTYSFKDHIPLTNPFYSTVVQRMDLLVVTRMNIRYVKHVKIRVKKPTRSKHGNISQKK